MSSKAGLRSCFFRHIYRSTDWESVSLKETDHLQAVHKSDLQNRVATGFFLCYPGIGATPQQAKKTIHSANAE